MVVSEAQIKLNMKKYLKILLALLFLVGCQQNTEKEETPAEEEEVTENRVSFVAVGDNLMHKRLIDVAKTDDGYDFSPYYTNIKSYIEAADLSFVNQETVLAGTTPSGYPDFSTPDEMAGNLHDVGFDIVNGATNHALDQGEEGLLHSISVFKQYEDMTYLGLYESQEDRDNIRVIESNGIKIAFLAYNQYTNLHDMPNDYCMNLFDKDVISQDVEAAKEISDFVIVSCHWGTEYDDVPSDFQKEYAQYLTDLGVDVILGTHTHTLQDVQYLTGTDGNQTLVAYSLGNFVSGMMEEETQLEGMLSFDLVKADDGTLSLDNVTLTPLINHYTASDSSDVYNSRTGFTVYRLKDYTDELASQHALNGYENITISIDSIKERVEDIITSDITIDM